MDFRRLAASLLILAMGPAGAAIGQPYPPDRDQPGDAIIQAYLARLAGELHAKPLDGRDGPKPVESFRDAYRGEYLDMLGLDPLPDRSPLEASVTGTLEEDGYVVEKLHYQSLPGLYVTASLYRPADVPPGRLLPGILYVCGHADMKRDGNKAAYQANGIWLARHGYVCLMVDTLQRGEVAGVHHGTYREGRWWWHSRGYTSAGVECWNGIRGLDYLASRPDVDPDRLGVTGISGGGAVTIWIAAADDRVRVAVPISGMSDLPSYVGGRVVNGHCDCMFLYNTHEWPWARIAALVAPRPLLFVNSDRDRIFPMDGNERVIARLERFFGQFGAGDRVDALVSVGGHAYREDIRRGAFRFLNTYLKGDARPVDDSEFDLVDRTGPHPHFPIEPSRLRVFPTDADLPADARNATIDRTFVPMAEVDLPEPGGFASWKDGLMAGLRGRTFRPLPARIPSARPLVETPTDTVLETEEGIKVELSRVSPRGQVEAGFVLAVADARGDAAFPARKGAGVYLVHPRGIGPTRWTTRNPPNTVERSLALLGRTADLGRIWDVAATARYLVGGSGEEARVVVTGSGAAGILGAYAALIEPGIDEVILTDPPASHMEDGAPQLLGILRTLDIPEALGMLAPRPLAIRGGSKDLRDRVAAIYDRAGAAEALDLR